MAHVHKQLQKLPKGGNAAHTSLGYSSSNENDTDFRISDVSVKVDILTVKTWLTSTARNYVLDGIDSDLITEYITNSTAF
jgi:hypothetical protein